MTKKLQVALYDDDSEWRDKHEIAVRAGLEAAGIDADVHPLGQEVADWAASIAVGDLKPTDRSPFADMDLAVIDTDLRRVAVQTSDRLALWLRCYTNVGAVATINPKPPEPDPVFSARLKPCFNQGWTDQGVFLKDLEDGHIWGAPSNGVEYHPSYWANLSVYGIQLAGQHEQVQQELDSSLRDYLGIPIESEERFPRSLFTNEIGGFDVTLRELVQHRLHRDDWTVIEGYDRAIARVAASLVRNWLKTEVIPLQNILTDAPHMVARYPSLLGEPETRNDAANKLAVGDAGLPEFFNLDSMRAAEFRGSAWCPRKLWWHELVAANQDIPDVANPSGFILPETHFMEDVSWFLPKGEEYRIPSASPYGSRYVTAPHNFARRYEPAGDFLL